MRVTEQSKLDTVLRSVTMSSERLDKATRVAASGQRVTMPSDDPVAYGEMVRRDYALVQLDQHQSTAQQSQGELEVVENALSSATDIMTKVQESAVSGANSTSDAASRKLLAADVRTMRSQLISIGNTRLGDKFLFGGTLTDKPPFDATTGAFSGNDQTIRVPVLDGVTTPGNVSGAKAFTIAGGKDVFDELDKLATALENNDDAGIRTALDPIQASHDQLVRSQVEAGVAAERFSSASDLITSTKAAVTDRLSSDVSGDMTQQLTDLTLARTAYERNVAVTKQLLSITTG